MHSQIQTRPDVCRPGRLLGEESYPLASVRSSRVVCGHARDQRGRRRDALDNNLEKTLG